MRDFIHPFVCALRDLLGVAPPKLHDAMQQTSINEDLLREQYTASDLSSRKDDFVLYRIIGNDLPPRHELGQSLRSLSFILQNEPQLSGCTKKFVINRVLDTETESKIIATLEDHGHEYIHIPFDPDVYVEIPLADPSGVYLGAIKFDL